MRIIDWSSDVCSSDLRAHARLAERMGPQALPALRRVPLSPAPRVQLARANADVMVIVSGSPARPVMTGQPQDIRRLEGDISLLASAAMAEKSLRMVQVEAQQVAPSVGAPTQGRRVIGRIAPPGVGREGDGAGKRGG